MLALGTRSAIKETNSAEIGDCRKPLCAVSGRVSGDCVDSCAGISIDLLPLTISTSLVSLRADSDTYGCFAFEDVVPVAREPDALISICLSGCLVKLCKVKYVNVSQLESMDGRMSLSGGERKVKRRSG
jgi:hypothetical protein